MNITNYETLVKKQLLLNKIPDEPQSCPECEGMGETEVECERCDGQGLIEEDCPYCDEGCDDCSDGFVEEDCDECQGEGFVLESCIYCDGIGTYEAYLEQKEIFLQEYFLRLRYSDEWVKIKRSGKIQDYWMM